TGCVWFSRDMFEQILAGVTPDCRLMMEEAVSTGEGGSELSDDCKMQIQQALETLMQDENFERSAGLSSGAGMSNTPVAPAGSSNTAVIVSIFVLLLLGSIGGAAAYISALRKDHFAERPEKKLSKQKA